MKVERTYCTLCAGVESPGFYTGCLAKDGHAPGWNCDGQGHLWRYIQNEDNQEEE